MNPILRRGVLGLALLIAFVILGCQNQPEPMGSAGETESSLRNPSHNAAPEDSDVSNPTVAEIEQGMRIFTLSVSTDNQPPNLQVGDYVDLYAQVVRRNSAEHMLVMEGVQIQFIGNEVPDNAGPRNSHYENVTIQIDRSQVPLLMSIHSRIVGNEFFLAIRNPNGLNPLSGDAGSINRELLELFGLEH